MDEFLTTAEVGAYFSVKRRCIITWIHKGLLTPHQQRGNKSNMFKKSEVEALKRPTISKKYPEGLLRPHESVGV